MRVLWFTNTLMPDACLAMGLPPVSIGGWMPALLQAFRKYFPNIEFVVLTTNRMHRRVIVDNVTYVTFGDPRKMVFDNDIPSDLEKEIQKLVDEFNPDLIHVHGTENFYARLNSFVLCNKPVLISLQGLINGYSQHYNGNLTPTDLLPFRTLRNRAFHDGVFENQEKWILKRSVQEKKSLSMHSYYAGRTNWDRAWLMAFNPSSTYYHLDEIIRSEFYGATRDPLNILPYSIYCSAAASYPLKGLHWLIRATAILKKKFPAIQIRIANAQRILSKPKGFVGYLKKNDYAVYLRDLISKLGLNENVIGLPQLAADEVKKELEKAHAFCLPSLCENSPNSLGEAMLVGVPCVANYVGGIPDMLENEKEGILCPAADSAVLAKALERIFVDEKFSARLAFNAQQTARERHDPYRIVKQTKNIYESIVNEFRG